MFKSVDYTGVEGNPELRAKAERATAALGDVIRTWREEVAVNWKPAAPDSSAALELGLSLALSNAAGRASGRVRPWTFEPGEEGELRSDLRGVWLNLLALLSTQQMSRLDEILREPAEA
jgi:hypothetical protein